MSCDRANLIGHPDFTAEAERVLGVLDGAVLVASAVEGAQPQTRVLMRTLRRLRIPALIFVNKIDRRGAGPARTLRGIERRLVLDVVPMTATLRPGTRAADAVPYTAADPAGTGASGVHRLGRHRRRGGRPGPQGIPAAGAEVAQLTVARPVPTVGQKEPIRRSTHGRVP